MRSGAPWPGSSTRSRGRWTAFLPQPKARSIPWTNRKPTHWREKSRTRGEEEKVMSKKHIEDCVRSSLDSYFRDLRGTEPDGMYEMLVRVVEKPLLDVVMTRAEGNQSKAAQWLGLNRNTLRKKLVEHKLLK